jgi:hypothetical protein
LAIIDNNEQEFDKTLFCYNMARRATLTVPLGYLFLRIVAFGDFSPDAFVDTVSPAQVALTRGKTMSVSDLPSLGAVLMQMVMFANTAVDGPHSLVMTKFGKAVVINVILKVTGRGLVYVLVDKAYKIGYKYILKRILQEGLVNKATNQKDEVIVLLDNDKITNQTEEVNDKPKSKGARRKGYNPITGEVAYYE